MGVGMRLHFHFTPLNTNGKAQASNTLSHDLLSLSRSFARKLQNHGFICQNLKLIWTGAELRAASRQQQRRRRRRRRERDSAVDQFLSSPPQRPVPCAEFQLPGELFNFCCCCCVHLYLYLYCLCSRALYLSRSLYVISMRERSPFCSRSLWRALTWPTPATTKGISARDFCQWISNWIFCPFYFACINRVLYNARINALMIDDVFFARVCVCVWLIALCTPLIIINLIMAAITRGHTNYAR